MLMPHSLSKLRQTAIWPHLRRLHRRTGPVLCSIIHSAVARTPRGLQSNNLALKHRYDYEILYLDPRTIERSVRVGDWARPQPSATPVTRFRRWLVLGGGWKHLRRNVSRNVHGRFVIGGDWDLYAQPFETRQSIRQLFVDGLHPTQTEEYRRMRDWVAKGELAWTRGCQTIEDVDQYFDEIVRLHANLRTEGYRTQLELGHDGADEIRICVDRSGRPCVFGGGTHRLSLALLLALPEVPVIVKRVHEEWVERCCSTYGTTDVHEAIARGLAALGGRSSEATEKAGWASA